MPGPAGNSIFIPTGPEPDYTSMLTDDPFYKQDLEWIAGQQATDKERLAHETAMAEKYFNLNMAQASASASGGGDYGAAAAERSAALAKEDALHNDALQKEYLNELMASRGMYDSGQRSFEQNERQWDLDMLNKQIESDRQGRLDSAAAARADAARGLSLRLEEMRLQHGDNLTRLGWPGEDIESNAKRATGNAGFAAYTRLKDSGKLNAPGIMAAWDETSGLYVTKDGQYYDAFGNPTSWSQPGSQAAPAAPSAPAAAPSAPADPTSYAGDPYGYDNYQAQNPYNSGGQGYY